MARMPLFAPVLVLALIFCLAPPASADRVKEDYIVLKGGMYVPEGDNLGSSSIDINGEIGFGHYFLPNLAVELSAGYFRTSPDIRTALFGQTVTAGATVQTSLIELAARPVLPFSIAPDRKLEFYALAGVGGYAAWATASMRVDGDERLFDGYSGFYGGFLGAGFSVDVTSTIYLGLEGKYLWTNTTHVRDNVSGVAAEFRLNGFRATVNMGLRF